MLIELYVSRYRGRLWVARREDGRTTELRVEPHDGRPRTGRVLRARVSKVIPGIQAAFVDLGGERDAFLHASELPAWDPPAAAPPIQQRLREGEALIVQVDREERRRKGARITARPAIAGRYLVLLPGQPGVAVSRRIPDREERRRLAQLLERMPDEGGGWIARTVACGVGRATLAAEAENILRGWTDAVSAAEKSKKLPVLVLREPDLLEEILRELPSVGVESIVVDEADDRQRMIERLAGTDPDLAARVRLHPDRDTPLFTATGIASEIDKALRCRVWLRSGGYVVIEETEALVSIDVNTGKNIGRRDFEQTVLETNLEAAVEIPRQLRLRGLGGIVVVDMIDMKEAASRTAVLERFREALQADPARTRVTGLDDIGLITLTRKALRSSLGDLVTASCPTCYGNGRVRTDEGSTID